jgi:predicted RNA-binding protein with PUA-like domain
VEPDIFGAMPKKTAAPAEPVRHWLMKSEADCFSFDDLLAAPKRTTCWDGVRNYQARNYMREMRPGDLVLFYHSSAEPAGVAGIAEVVKAAYTDHTAFDAAHEHYDPKSKADTPLWDMVDIRAVERLPHFVTLDDLRGDPALADMVVLRRGNRLSVTPVAPLEWAAVRRLGGL